MSTHVMFLHGIGSVSIGSSEPAESSNGQKYAVRRISVFSEEEQKEVFCLTLFTRHTECLPVNLQSEHVPDEMLPGDCIHCDKPNATESFMGQRFHMECLDEFQKEYEACMANVRFHADPEAYGPMDSGN